MRGAEVSGGALSGAGKSASPPVSLLPQAVNANAKIKMSAMAKNLFVFIDLFSLKTKFSATDKRKNLLYSNRK